MSHVLRVGVADQIAYFRAFNTDGSAKTDLTSATPGLALSVFRAGLASVAIASLTNKAADDTAHSDGAIRNVGGNLYTVDLPDAVTATQCPSIGVRGTYTGGMIEPVPHPLVGYNPAVAAVGANTVTPPTVAELNARTLPSADYFDPATDGVKVTGIGTATVSVDGANVSFPTAIGTSNLSPFNVATVLSDNNIVTTSQLNARTLVAAEYATAAAMSNVQGRLPSALVAGKMSSHIATEDRVGYALSAGYEAGLVAAIDAGLLNAGDATDLIASIVSRIDNTNVDEASLVAAIKASLFAAGSIANKIEVDGSGRVTVGTNADKTGYSLGADQAVNVSKVGGITVTGPGDLKADVSGLATLTSVSGLATQSSVNNWFNLWGSLLAQMASETTSTLNSTQALRRWFPLLIGVGADPVVLAELNATAAGATFDNATDSLQALRDRGDAAWSGGGATPEEIWAYDERTLTSAPAEIDVDTAALAAAIADQLTSSGQYRLTVEVTDEHDDAVPGVTVQILGVAGTTRETRTDGHVLIDLDPETYTLRVTVPAGYESVPDRTIEIIDEDVAEVIELVSTVFLPSEAAPYCMTRFAVQDQFTETAEGTLIDVEFVRFLPGATRTAVVISPSEPLVTGAEGYVDRKLNRLAEYSAKYAVPGKLPKSLRFTTPDAGSYEVVEP